MATRKKQLRTANYSEKDRIRLADAVIKAREAAGYRWRTDFARAIQASGVKVSVRSLAALEQAEPTVGRSILYAVGRALPNWTEDTPRIILEDGPIPPTVAEQTQGQYPHDNERQQVWDQLDHDYFTDAEAAAIVEEVIKRRRGGGSAATGT